MATVRVNRSGTGRKSRGRERRGARKIGAHAAADRRREAGAVGRRVAARQGGGAVPWREH